MPIGYHACQSWTVLDVRLVAENEKWDLQCGGECCCGRVSTGCDKAALPRALLEKAGIGCAPCVAMQG